MPAKILVVALMLAYALPCQAQPRGFYYTGFGEVTFRSDAKQEFIKASSRELKGVVNMSSRTFAFTIQMRTFEGFNSALQQEHFNEKYLESDKFPEARFSGKIIEDIPILTTGPANVRVKGKLEIHGVTRERIIRGRIQATEKGIEIESSFIVNLADHDIKVPKVVHEKIAREINVEIKAVLFPGR